ncbi:lysoplasmalogenase family protein [Sphingoaurantiacus capsulatus]|uniref:Lysoplasmalogenase family protein n=1 Tax=Sphingoaurantiacus capsulatus TaxID=1771310 RepID=A0ABV7XDH4_9SPHN
MTADWRSPLLLASLVAAIAYPLFWGSGLPQPGMIALKGLGVGLLAVLAATQARSRDGWLFAAVMGFGALGDVLLDIRFEAGVAAFAVGHIIAIVFYRRNRRVGAPFSRRAFAALIAIAGTILPFFLIDLDDPRLAGLVVYSLLLTAMAAAAWLSRFPRALTGVGALLFVFSDGLIAARMGPLADAAWAGYGIWATYYLGQLLIFLGVSRTLEGSHHSATAL